MTVLSDFVLLEILDAFCVGNTIPWLNSVGGKKTFNGVIKMLISTFS